MDDSFSHWRDSVGENENKYFLISDSDDDVIEGSGDEEIVIPDSTDDNMSICVETPPKKSIAQRRSTELQPKEVIQQENKSYNITDTSDSDDSYSPVHNSMRNTSDTRSHEDLLQDDENKDNLLVAINLARSEIGVGNIDTLAAQKRALLVCKMHQLQNQVVKTKLLLATGNMDLLPDNGEKLRQTILVYNKEIEEIQATLDKTPLVLPANDKPIETENEMICGDADVNFVNKHESSVKYADVSNTSLKHTLSPEVKEFGKKAQETRDRELALTAERIQDLHGSLVARPTEDERAEDPKGLKIQLMPHQQHALAWLLWREKQRPAGGVLADDMGLGKTLTMISLIIASLAKDTDAESESDDDWGSHNKTLHRKGGTLVVCPASLLAQWEGEIKNRCKRGTLSVGIYHGSNRETQAKRLAKHDVVITTYNILTREFKTMSTVYKIHWKRIILDEAHVIRNHKSQMCESVCGLVGSRRWALTGTPIQNKEMDLYSILKFLKCSPFDDIRVWKRWVDNKNASGHQRLATVMKTLMLRRTKQELHEKGTLQSLPNKCAQEIEVKLDAEEQLVYEKVLVYSRTLFAQFLSQKAEKEHMADLQNGMYNRPSFMSNPNKSTQFTKAQNKLLALHADVKTHEILVLLLRLRQICCHPALIRAMLDQQDMQQSGIMDDENLDPNLLSKVNSMALCESENDTSIINENLHQESIGIDHRITKNILTSTNPVFESHRMSSKLKIVLHTIEEILEKNDKLIVVSQWTSMLDVVASHLSSIKGATYSTFTGNLAVKNRQAVMDSFNNAGDPKILLLSLTAGGVGLNLVGANHLLLIDIHWNPQLESQAEDRIYRFGQTKDVHIYRFICKDTIEERIKQLQQGKLGIARNVLSGEVNTVSSKLTLNDLKLLFAL